MWGSVLSSAAAAALAAGLLVAPATAGAAPPAAAPAPSGRIVYECGANLCAVDPATGESAQITTDGAGYSSPDVSADGTRVAAERDGDVVVGAYGANLTGVVGSSQGILDIAVSPDGSAVADSHSFISTITSLCWPGPYVCLEMVAYNDSTHYVVGGTEEQEQTYDGGNGAAYSATGGLVSGFYDVDRDAHGFCYVATPAAPEQACAELFVRSESMTAPDLSPDGSMLAVTQWIDSDNAEIVLYSTAGVPLRVLAPIGYTPTFSPDGKWVAYAGNDGWIYRVPTAGGTPVRVVQGGSPAWGGGSIGSGTGGAKGTARVSGPRTVKVKRGRLGLKVSCSAAGPCAGSVKVTVRGRVVTRPKRFSVAAGRTATVRVRLNAAGTKALKRSRRVKAVALVGKARTKLTLRR